MTDTSKRIVEELLVREKEESPVMPKPPPVELTAPKPYYEFMDDELAYTATIQFKGEKKTVEVHIQKPKSELCSALMQEIIISPSYYDKVPMGLACFTFYSHPGICDKEVEREFICRGVEAVIHVMTGAFFEVKFKEEAK